jgi:hypothetical protein
MDDRFADAPAERGGDENTHLSEAMKRFVTSQQRSKSFDLNTNPCAITLSEFIFGEAMRVKKTIKNQITLPNSIATHFVAVSYFDVQSDGETIVLTPVSNFPASKIQTRLAQLGIDEQDIDEAISWARSRAKVQKMHNE